MVTTLVGETVPAETLEALVRAPTACRSTSRS
jgi:hypothetical protein